MENSEIFCNFVADNQQFNKILLAMISKDKVIEIFFIIDEFCKEFEEELSKQPVLASDGVRKRNRKASMSHSEIMTILLLYHFGTFRNFKHFYLHYVKVHLAGEFPTAVSYNRFVELEGRVFFHMMFFLNLRAFGTCTGITFVDSTMIPVCHNLRRYANRVFKGLATDGNHRRRTLFKRACLRRLINPYVDANTLLFNMYLDFHRFIDNTDHIITLDTLIRRTRRAMTMTYDELREYCQYEINYWKNHRPKFIMHPDAPKSQAFINFVTKRIHYAELDLSYDRTKSVQENAAALGISPATLYRYCSDRYIETNPGKGQTYVQKRQAKKQDKADKKATFMLYYDPNLSAAKNREKMLQYGLNLSVGTIRNWGKEYAMPSIPTSSTSPSPESSILNLGPINVTVPSFNSSWWNSWESDPLYAEYEAKWREACRR